MSSSCLFVLLATLPVITFQCLRTAAVSSPVVEPVTDPTTTNCPPTSIIYGQADGGTSIAVTYSDYVADNTAQTATMTVSCSAASPTGFASMSIIATGNEEFTPLENEQLEQTVSITLTCSYATQDWVYSATVAGVTTTKTVLEVDCEGS